MKTIVRRVHPYEWRLVRALRLTALRDPDAGIAYLDTSDEVARRDDAFWQQRTAEAASGESAAQFVAVRGDAWVGTVTGLARAAGSVDHLGRPVTEPRIDVVGVYVHPDARGAGLLDRLLDAVADWSQQQDAQVLTLDVHVENSRALAAYRRCGFADSGARFSGPIGPELEMVRSLAPAPTPSPWRPDQAGTAQDS